MSAPTSFLNDDPSELNPVRESRWFVSRRRGQSACIVLIFVLAASGFHGCNRRQREPDRVLSTNGEFGVFWPPRYLGRPPKESDTPLMTGKLTVMPFDGRSSNTFRMHITLQRPAGENDRLRWNETLKFPEHAWMSEVRVWDAEKKWLWPNLPFLLRAHGKERVERYGGADPGNGVDNDFAAILIRFRDPDSQGSRAPADSEKPLVSAEWTSPGSGKTDRHSVVHTARSDDFHVRLTTGGGRHKAGKLAVWLIYADFLGAIPPRRWPARKEYAGGILAYFEVSWTRPGDGDLQFEIEQLIPPSDTGFDWAAWSTGPLAREKNLDLIDRP